MAETDPLKIFQARQEADRTSRELAERQRVKNDVDEFHATLGHYATYLIQTGYRRSERHPFKGEDYIVSPLYGYDEYTNDGLRLFLLSRQEKSLIVHDLASSHSSWSAQWDRVWPDTAKWREENRIHVFPAVTAEGRLTLSNAAVDQYLHLDTPTFPLSIVLGDFENNIGYMRQQMGLKRY